MTTNRLTLTEDEVRALQMLAFSAGGAATLLYPDSIVLGATANALNALVNGDVAGAQFALRCLATESTREPEDAAKVTA